jgi:hypothetical protein
MLKHILIYEKNENVIKMILAKTEIKSEKNTELSKAEQAFIENMLKGTYTK